MCSRNCRCASACIVDNYTWEDYETWHALASDIGLAGAVLLQIDLAGAVCC